MMYSYQIDGVHVTLIDPPVDKALKGRKRRERLAEIAEAWQGYAVGRYGPGAVGIQVSWDEHGRVSHSVEMREDKKS